MMLRKVLPLVLSTFVGCSAAGGNADAEGTVEDGSDAFSESINIAFVEENDSPIYPYQAADNSNTFRLEYALRLQSERSSDLHDLEVADAPSAKQVLSTKQNLLLRECVHVPKLHTSSVHETPSSVHKAPFGKDDQSNAFVSPVQILHGEAALTSPSA